MLHASYSCVRHSFLHILCWFLWKYSILCIIHVNIIVMPSMVISYQDYFLNIPTWSSVAEWFPFEGYVDAWFPNEDYGDVVMNAYVDYAIQEDVLETTPVSGEAPPSKTRSNFPESWIWTDFVCGCGVDWFYSPICMSPPPTFTSLCMDSVSLLACCSH